MSDIELAKAMLNNESSLVIVKDGECIFSENGPWIYPIIAAYEELGKNMAGSSVADRIMGKAAAILCIRGGATEVFTPIISAPALKVLTSAGVLVSYDLMVPGIVNPAKSDLCLAEKTLMEIDDPETAFHALWRLVGKSPIEHHDTEERSI